MKTLYRTFAAFFLLISTAQAQIIEVTFYHTPVSSDFTNLYLGGNITEWVPNNSAFEMLDIGGDGTYELTVSVDLSVVSQIQYKFIPDGDWSLSYADPKNPISSGDPNYNSLLDLSSLMFSFFAPSDKSQGINSGIIEADIAFTTGGDPLSNQWKLEINAMEIAHADTYYDPSSKKFTYDASGQLQTGRNSILLEMGNSLLTVSTSVTFYYYSPDREYVTIDAVEMGETLSLTATGFTNDSRPLSFSWIQDDSNPGSLTFSSFSGSVVAVSNPSSDGEYFINLIATDDEGMSFSARRIIEVKNGSMTYHTVDHYASWIDDMILYEINTYAWHSYDSFLAGKSVFDNVADHFDELEALGVNTLWFTPIFDGEGLGYHTSNYFEILEYFGTEDDFSAFMLAAHDRGFKIVLDLVFNHTGKKHHFFESTLVFKEASPFADHYLWDGTPGSSSYSYLYDWDFIPSLQVSNPEVEEYLINVAEYWLANFDIDGYRTDVAWGVEQRSGTLWKNMTERLKNIKPEMYLLAEAGAAATSGTYESVPSSVDGGTILFEDRFTSAYDWELRGFEDNKGLSGILGRHIEIDVLHEVLSENLPERALPLRFIENHDHKRVTDLYDIERSKLSHTLVFTVPGVPLIYGGAETGQKSQSEGRGSDTHLVEPFFQKLINARNKYIKNNATLTRLSNTLSTDVYSYATVSDDGNVVVTALNFSNEARTFTIDLASLASQLDAPLKLVDLLEDDHMDLEASELGNVSMTLNAYGTEVFRFKTNEAPVFEDQQFSLNENSLNGSIVGQLIWSDPDEDGLTFTILSGNTNGAFAVTTDGKLTVSNEDEMDFESTNQFILGIEADDGNEIKQATITVLITDLNEEIVLQSKKALAKSAFTIFPNPAKEMASISIKNLNAHHLKLKIYNSLGQLIAVKNFKVSGTEVQVDLNLEDFKTGVYQMHLSTGEKNELFKLLVK